MTTLDCPRRHGEPVIAGGRRTVFLDRDGVLLRDPGYLSDPDAVELLPGVPDALRRLRAAEWRLVVVTNQSGVARGRFTEATLAEIHARMEATLQADGAHLDAIYYCPHLPNATVPEYRHDCSCRKPQPGMLRAAAEALGLDLAASWMVGDKYADVAAGQAVGCRSLLVQPEGTVPEDTPIATPDGVVGSLAEAADVILGSG